MADSGTGTDPTTDRCPDCGHPYDPVADLFPATRRWRRVKPHGTGAAYRRHYRRGEPMCPPCRAWHRGDEANRRQRTMTKRWSETQHKVAEWFRGHGWPFAEAVGNGRAGVDVTGMPALSIEVKALNDERRPVMMLKQAGQRPGLPLVVHRPPGFGPATIGEWVVYMRLQDATWLLRAAGFGEPLTEDEHAS